MHRRLTSLLRLQLLALVLTAPAWSHDFWLEPSSFRPAADSPLFARLRVGEHFRGEALPRYDPWIKRFLIHGPSGETPMLGLDGSEPAGLSRVTVPGLHHIVYESTANYLELEPDLFEEALRLEGLERVIELRAQRGESDQRSKEDFYRCAKALVLVGGSPGQNFDRLFGLPLEIVPENDPYTMQPGDRLSVRLLFDGQPLEGALVMALNQADPDESLQARSDSNGHAEFTLVHPGNWLIKAVHCVPARVSQTADWESFWASLTFALGPAAAAGSTVTGSDTAGSSADGATSTTSTDPASAAGVESQVVSLAFEKAPAAGFARVPGAALVAAAATQPTGPPGASDSPAPGSPAAQTSSAASPQSASGLSPARSSSDSMDPRSRRLVGFGAGFLVAVITLFLFRGRASRG